LTIGDVLFDLVSINTGYLTIAVGQGGDDGSSENESSIHDGLDYGPPSSPVDLLQFFANKTATALALAPPQFGGPLLLDLPVSRPPLASMVPKDPLSTLSSLLQSLSIINDPPSMMLPQSEPSDQSCPSRVVAADQQQGVTGEGELSTLSSSHNHPDAVQLTSNDPLTNSSSDNDGNGDTTISISEHTAASDMTPDADATPHHVVNATTTADSSDEKKSKPKVNQSHRRGRRHVKKAYHRRARKKKVIDQPTAQTNQSPKKEAGDAKCQVETSNGLLNNNSSIDEESDGKSENPIRHVVKAFKRANEDKSSSDVGINKRRRTSLENKVNHGMVRFKSNPSHRVATSNDSFDPSASPCEDDVSDTSGGDVGVDGGDGVVGELSSSLVDAPPTTNQQHLEEKPRKTVVDKSKNYPNARKGVAPIPTPTPTPTLISIPVADAPSISPITLQSSHGTSGIIGVHQQLRAKTTPSHPKKRANAKRSYASSYAIDDEDASTTSDGKFASPFHHAAVVNATTTVPQSDEKKPSRPVEVTIQPQSQSSLSQNATATPTTTEGIGKAAVIVGHRPYLRHHYKREQEPEVGSSTLMTKKVRKDANGAATPVTADAKQPSKSKTNISQVPLGCRDGRPGCISIEGTHLLIRLVFMLGTICAVGTDIAAFMTEKKKASPNSNRLMDTVPPDSKLRCKVGSNPICITKETTVRWWEGGSVDGGVQSVTNHNGGQTTVCVDYKGLEVIISIKKRKHPQECDWLETNLLPILKRYSGLPPFSLFIPQGLPVSPTSPSSDSVNSNCSKDTE
jgi:hypothetical protein